MGKMSQQLPKTGSREIYPVKIITSLPDVRGDYSA